MSSRSFNADEKTQEILGAEVTIGGQVFHPARLTPDVRRAQMAIATEGAKAAQESGLGRDPGPDGFTSEQLDRRADAVGRIDQGVNAQLQVLLRDAHDRQPSEEFLAAHLDNRVATKLLGWLLEDDESEGEEQATTPPASGP